jgi:hypothetical protein
MNAHAPVSLKDLASSSRYLIISVRVHKEGFNLKQPKDETTAHVSSWQPNPYGGRSSAEVEP